MIRSPLPVHWLDERGPLDYRYTPRETAFGGKSDYQRKLRRSAFFNFVNNADGVNPIAALHGGGPAHLAGFKEIISLLRFRSPSKQNEIYFSTHEVLLGAEGSRIRLE